MDYHYNEKSIFQPPLYKSINANAGINKQILKNLHKISRIRVHSQNSKDQTKRKPPICHLRQQSAQNNKKSNYVNALLSNTPVNSIFDKDQKQKIEKMSVNSIRCLRNVLSTQFSDRHRRKDYYLNTSLQNSSSVSGALPPIVQLYIKFPQMSLMQTVLKIQKNDIQLKQSKPKDFQSLIIRQIPKKKNLKELTVVKKKRLKRLIFPQSKNAFKKESKKQEIAGWTLNQFQ